MNPTKKMLRAARAFWAKFDIVIQPPGWERTDYTARCEMVIAALSPNLQLSLDEPILDALVCAIDGLPPNEGITAILERRGCGAWFLVGMRELSFFEPEYEKYGEMLRVSLIVTTERAAIKAKPINVEEVKLMAELISRKRAS